MREVRGDGAPSGIAPDPAPSRVDHDPPAAARAQCEGVTLPHVDHVQLGEGAMRRHEGLEGHDDHRAEGNEHRARGPFGEAGDDHRRGGDRTRDGAGHGRHDLGTGEGECRSMARHRAEGDDEQMRGAGGQLLDGAHGDAQRQEEHRLQHAHDRIGDEVGDGTEQGDAPEGPGDERGRREGCDDADDRR